MSRSKVIEDVTIPASSARAFVMKKGQIFRVTVPEGGTVGDFVAFNAADQKERFDQARTKVNQSKIFLSKGDRLISKFNNVMFTINEDTYGHHDLQYGMCSKWVFDNVSALREYCLKQGLAIPTRGCWENLADALEPWNIPKEDIPSPFNIFQTVEIDGKTGKMENLPVKTKPGDHIDLMAEMNCLVAISNSPIFGFPLRLQILEQVEEVDLPPQLVQL